MVKASFFFLAMCAACATESVMGNGYYLPGYPDPMGSLMGYGLGYGFAPLLPQDCDKSKEAGEGSESESSGEEKKGEEESSSEEGGEESKSSSEEEGGESKEGSEEKGESEEKKEEAPKPKETNYAFPPVSYAFPARQLMYVPSSSYNYYPYTTSYAPLRTAYQYVSLPSVAKAYSAPVVNYNPLTRLLYTNSAVTYPAASKSIVSPGAQVYSNAVAWNSPLSYYKK